MIFHVEDEQNIRDLVVFTLRMTGFEAEGFESGAELRRALEKTTPELILLDEPTTYMDMSCEADFLRLLTGLRDQCGKTLMVVMHNLTQAVAFADDIVVLDGGKACFCGSAHDCVQSGIIERVFQVRRCDYVSEGRSGVFYQG